MSKAARRVVVCSTGEQSGVASDLAESLRNAGLDTALLRESAGGEDGSPPEERIDGADSIVVLIAQSPTTQDRSGWKKVLEAHWSHPETVIVPVLIDDAKLPAAFAEYAPLKLNPSGGAVGGDSASFRPKLLAALTGPRFESAKTTPEINRQYVKRLDAIGDISRSMGFE